MGFNHHTGSSSIDAPKQEPDIVLSEIKNSRDDYNRMAKTPINAAYTCNNMLSIHHQLHQRDLIPPSVNL